ncbi:MAG: hypothetical protein AB7F86_02645 [Bdellovibrionales bacterium]
MKITNLLASLILSAFAFSAHAYKTGHFECKAADTALPDTVYDIEDIAVGTDTLPYVKVTTHFADSTENGPTVREVTMRGLANISMSGGREILTVGGIRLVFEGDNFLTCRE